MSRPEGYIDTESEISKKMKAHLQSQRDNSGWDQSCQEELNKHKRAPEKQAEMDGEAISRMGDLAMRFADSFEDIMSEIRTMTYAEQLQIHTGFINDLISNGCGSCTSGLLRKD